ncbi:MAG: hypothetical protein M5U34_09195 [Chloroflexi bacterium]|nr:hypothetical protein [Chloroflexota bacterium]
MADKPINPEQACWLILPSGGRNGDVLRRDVRVKTLLQTLNGGLGCVVVTDGGSELAEDVAGLITESAVFPA